MCVGGEQVDIVQAQLIEFFFRRLQGVTGPTFFLQGFHFFPGGGGALQLLIPMGAFYYGIHPPFLIKYFISVL